MPHLKNAVQDMRKQYQRLGKEYKESQTGATVGECLSADGRQVITIRFRAVQDTTTQKAFLKVLLANVTMQRLWPMGLFSSVAFTGYLVLPSWFLINNGVYDPFWKTWIDTPQQELVELTLSTESPQALC